jgi:hypothetical protein
VSYAFKHTTGRFGYGPLALVSLYIDHFLALVVAAVGANVMRKPHLAAVGALHQLARLERVVCAASVASALGSFPFWKRGHNLTPTTLLIHINICHRADNAL